MADTSVEFEQPVGGEVRDAITGKLIELFGEFGFGFQNLRPEGRQRNDGIRVINKDDPAGSVGFITFNETAGWFGGEKTFTKMTIPNSVFRVLSSDDARKAKLKEFYTYLAKGGLMSVKHTIGWPVDAMPTAGGYRHMRHLRKWKKTARRHHKKAASRRRRHRRTVRKH